MLLINLMFLLIFNALFNKRELSLYYSRVSIIILLYCTLLSLSNFYMSSLNINIGLYSGLYFVTFINNIFNTFIFIITTIILHITGFYGRNFWSLDYSGLNKLLFYNLVYPTKKILNKTAEHFTIIEYSLMLLFIIIGGISLISANDLISMYLSVELQSYGLYLLSAFYKNSELSTYAGLTYFLLGGLSSCFILLGASLLYVNSGTTSFENIYIINGISNVAEENSINILNWYDSFFIQTSLLIMSVGFLFKVSAAPFHFWSPDVYDAIPTIVTTFVAIVAKISILIFMLDLVHNIKKIFFTFNYIWTISLLVSSLLSMIIGAIMGLTQFRIKKLLAYSTISHIGFVLLALSINSIESTQAFIFYLIQYTISNLNAFLLLISIGFSLNFYSKENINYKYMQDKNNSPIQMISQIKGYFYINPVLALSLAITLFSFVGVPPLIGFFGKQMVLSAALDKKYTFIVLVGIITSVISAVYYLNVVKEIFFSKPEYKCIDSNNTSVSSLIVLNHNKVNSYFNGKEEDFFQSTKDGKFVFQDIKESEIYNNMTQTYKTLSLESLISETFLNKNKYNKIKTEADKERGKIIFYPSKEIILDNFYGDISEIKNFSSKDIKLSGFYSTMVSVFTLIIVLFILSPKEPLNISSIAVINI